MQQPPPVQRVRLRYAKRGPARFTSHRDVSRALERALRRAGVPMAYSSGFTPHPRISYGGASPTGAASEAEYLELGLASEVSLPRLVAALNEVLPQGIVMLDAAPATKVPLGELLQVSDWQIALDQVDPMRLAAAVAGLLAADSYQVERTTRKGQRSFDVRAAILALQPVTDGLELRLLHQTPLVRPDDVLTALQRLDPQLPRLATALLRRTNQGRLDPSGDIEDPLR